MLFLAGASACATVPGETYRGYAGPARPAAAVATIDLGDASWARIEYAYAARPKHAVIEVPPGVHQIEWGRVFAVSVMINASGFAEHGTRATVTLEAGHRYRLGADRTHGPGYEVFLWIEDLTAQRVVAGHKNL
jgi:hypothetical protein